MGHDCVARITTQQCDPLPEISPFRARLSREVSESLQKHTLAGNHWRLRLLPVDDLCNGKNSASPLVFLRKQGD